MRPWVEAVYGIPTGTDDLQMLQWTAAGEGRRLMVIVHHTDADREWAYDKESHVGKLDKALQQASQSNWTVVDMKKDWMLVYPER